MGTGCPPSPAGTLLSPFPPSEALTRLSSAEGAAAAPFRAVPGTGAAAQAVGDPDGNPFPSQSEARVGMPCRSRPSRQGCAGEAGYGASWRDAGGSRTAPGTASPEFLLLWPFKLNSAFSSRPQNGSI